ncbi:MAG: hypothetical protein Pg6B_10100 [Candidatus Azobacteroides pseudotrichonymphae]|nr:MAG: hypothetical protein Pg6B_10100 [Candidatus Azobacteroides pseudotrichonymphae]
MTIWRKWLSLFLRKKKFTEIIKEEKVEFTATNEIFLSANSSPIPIEFIQSYLLSASKHHFSDDEKCVLHRLVECFQLDKEGQYKEGQYKDFLIKQSTNGDVEIALSLKEGEDPMQIKKALENLQKRTIPYENEGVCTTMNLLVKPKIFQFNRTVTLRLHQEVYEALLNLPHNYQKQELEAVMTFRSIYTRRFYDLLKGQNEPIHYSIESIRTLLELGDKYKKTHDFLKRVVEQARKELDQQGTFSFTYQLEYEKKQVNPRAGKKKVIGIIITPVYLPEQMDNIPPMQGMKQRLSESDEQDSVRTVLKSMFGFSGNDLVRLTDAVSRNGGHSYLTQLLQSCKGNIEKIKEKLKQLS